MLSRKKNRYCSNKCQAEFQYHSYIDDWKAGRADGKRGVSMRTLSAHLVRYLRDRDKACSICGWNMKNPTTGKVPLEIDHIDGNSENNRDKTCALSVRIVIHYQQIFVI